MCDGSLKDHLQLAPIIGLDNMIRQLLNIVELLEAVNICHNDVKPSNLLYVKTVTNGKTSIELKLSDFGMSDRSGGTAGWSPHNFTDERKPGDDIYSFGLIILYVICEKNDLFYIIRDSFLADHSIDGSPEPLINAFRNLPEIKIILQMIDVKTTPKIQNIKAFDQILQNKQKIFFYHVFLIFGEQY